MKKLLLSSATLAFGLSAGIAPVAFAQDSSEDEARQATVVVTGTRRAARSAADSPAPIDVVSADDLLAQSSNDVSDLLRTSVPSYNVGTQPISDAASLIRPANLRGLSPDNTLVLINGKRLHRAGVIAFLGGGVSDGSQGPDISAIPSLALKQVEVLRDGASSQYGSDAIAGVINFILDDSSEGGRIQAKVGSTYEGDGQLYQIAGNVGLPVGDSGYLNLTAEYGETDATSRSVQRQDAVALAAAGYPVPNPAMIWGQPNVNGDLKLVSNFGYEVNENLEVYAVGTYAERNTEGGFYYRNPTNRGGVYAGPSVNPATGYSVNTNDMGTDDTADDTYTDSVTGAVVATPSASVKVGNVNGLVQAACPQGIPLDGLTLNPTILAQVTADANCFSFVETIPGGFTPRFGGYLHDQSLAIGARGTLDFGTGLNYDFSARHGENQIDFFIRNTVNASLGADTPRDFAPGGYGQIESVINADFSYAIPAAALASDLNVGFGYEYRTEQFEIREGDGASYAIGPLASPTVAFPTGQGFSSSSNGFGGFTPGSAGKSEQTANSVYVDLEADVTDALTLQGAVRYEDYDTFGGDTNFKLGGLYKITDNFRVRGTYSTGYHVPTAGQANVVNVTTEVVQGVLNDTGTFPLNSAAGQVIADYVATPVSTTSGVLGGLGLARPTLKPEQAQNLSIGTVFNVGDFEVTLDYFNIKLEDRISRSSNIAFIPALQLLAQTSGVTLTGTSTSQIINELNAAGALNAADFAGSEDLTVFGFFNNAFDTTTSGVEFVVSGPLNFIKSGNTDLTIAGNFIQTEVDRADATISAGRVRVLEEGLPRQRVNATINHDRGAWSGMFRLNYFGEGYDDEAPVVVDAAFLVDAEIGYALDNGLDIKIGAANLLDQYPNESPSRGGLGQLYPQYSAYGFSGGTYYLKLGYSF